MRKPFFSRFAFAILLAVVFAVPIVFGGAFFAVRDSENKVEEWLPSSFFETRVLSWFRERFMGEQFVLISWEGCQLGDDPAYKERLQSSRRQNVQQLELARAELAYVEQEDDLQVQRAKLLQAGDAERAKLSKKIVALERALPDALDRIYRLQLRERQSILGQIARLKKESLSAPWIDRKKILEDVVDFNEAAEELEKKPEPPTTSAESLKDQIAEIDDKIHGLDQDIAKLLDDDPRLELLAHKLVPEGSSNKGDGPNYFNSVITGRRLLSELTDPRLAVPYQEAVDRLSGSLIAPRSPDQADGQQARQTCLVVTLSQEAQDDLRKVLGRGTRGPLGFGRDPGHIFTIFEECGISKNDVHMGGPPVDNCTIDEEGEKTLQRLVGLSTLVGVLLAWFSFRSVKLTALVFACGGLSGATALAIVYFSGSRMDAVLMSMPAVVYVLAISGAIHIVNYYYDAAEEGGLIGASDRAVGHGITPCTLAALTTAMGLLSLCSSNLIPIYKFGLYSAIGVIATLFVLFTYLPSALQFWPAVRKKRSPDIASSSAQAKTQSIAPEIADSSTLSPISRLTDRASKFVIRRHSWVMAVSLTVMIVCGVGVTKITTTVEILKLFDSDSRIIADYAWLQKNLGNLVPMEVVLRIDASTLLGEESYRREPAEPSHAELMAKHDPEYVAAVLDGQSRFETAMKAERLEAAAEIVHEVNDGSSDQKAFDGRPRFAASDGAYLLNFLDRMELVRRVQIRIERLKEIARTTSVGTFYPGESALTRGGQYNWIRRKRTNVSMSRNRENYYDNDYLHLERSNSELEITRSGGSRLSEFRKKYAVDTEMWRIGARVDALSGTDYSKFVSEIQQAVEPVLAIYHLRRNITRRAFADHHEAAMRVAARDEDPEDEPEADQKPSATMEGKSVCLLGVAEMKDGQVVVESLEQSFLLADLLRSAGARVAYHDPVESLASLSQKALRKRVDPNWIHLFHLKEMSSQPLVGEDAQDYDYYVLLNDRRQIDSAMLASLESQGKLIDVRGFVRAEIKRTAGLRDQLSEAFENGESDGSPVIEGATTAVYTGVVPLVYKTQRELLAGLINSVEWAFMMIAGVMMAMFSYVALRDRFSNLRALRAEYGVLGAVVRGTPLVAGSLVSSAIAGLMSMLPNLFPVIVVFGVMGWSGIPVDIGTMMAASVGLGVAVDDTIHFLTWFRRGMAEGMNRREATLMAYRRVSRAMMQTTLIAGFGLAVFAISTFTPTQRFGYMMLTLLGAALVGDLLILPAILAGPAGWFFGQKASTGDGTTQVGNAVMVDATTDVGASRSASETSYHKPKTAGDSVIRHDHSHKSFEQDKK